MAGRPGRTPVIEALTDAALDRARAVYETTKSVPAALASAGLRGSDFITGWKRRDSPLDIGLVDESSMLDERQFEDLTEIFPALVLFGDPAQLAPVGQSGEMVFDRFKPAQRLELNRVHRQEADNPILDLAHALGRPGPDLRALRAHDRGRRRQRRPRPHRAARRQRHDGPLPRAGLAQRHAHPPDHRLPRRPWRAGGSADPGRAAALRRDRTAAEASQAAHRPGGARPHQGRAGDLSRPRQQGRVFAPACDRRRKPAPVRRLHRQDRKTGGGGAVHPLRRAHGRHLPARGGGDDPQGAGLPMARGAGLRPRPLRRRAVGPDRGGAGAVEAAGLRGDHPGGGTADLGDALHAVETAGGLGSRT
jgi:hypothetical protein